ncbi:MAG TPA: hypothetical protein VMW56_09355 [Candidatus Margulisiibacteriota bacterium]|nr:hypothetical protein [Candidatus Margulisiibacteriota bacterium]
MTAGHCRRGGVLLILCVAVTCAPSLARADDWKDFAPRPFENGAFLDLYSSYEHDKIRTSSVASSRWTDTFIREKVTLFSDGYSYHPRFVQYRFSISGSIKQEDYESSFSSNSSGWTNKTGLDYEFRLFFLPEHHYNATAFALRYEPLFKEQSASQHSSVETEEGGSFRYRKKPFFFHTGGGQEHIESGLTTTDIERFFLDGEYFKRFRGGNEMSFNGAFNPSWYNSTGGISGNTYQYLAGNTLNLASLPVWLGAERIRLTSNLSKLTSDEQSGTAFQDFTNDQQSAYELLSAYLPYNFRSDLRYYYTKNDATIGEPAGLPSQKLSNKTNDIDLDVVHRLFESVDTTYTFLDTWQDSSGGHTSFVGHSGTVNYTKSIPWGTLLLGTNVGTGETDSSGQTSVVNEPHPAVSVPGSFVLGQPNADPLTIIVFLESPLPPFELIRLVENVDYTVIPVQNTFEIRIFNLPPQFVVPGTYNFRVSYSLLPGEYKLRTDNYGANGSLQLFNDLFTPYFSYVAIRSHVLSGVFPGVPLDSTTYTGGFILQRAPLRLRGEYQDFQWAPAPYTAWLGDLQYVSALTPTLSVYGIVSYLNKHYPQGSPQFSETLGGYTEETVTTSANIQKQLVERNLFLSAGATYSHLTGLVDSDSYAANGSVIWRVGKVELIVGANAYGSDSSGANTVSTRHEHELFYVNFRRRLF